MDFSADTEGNWCFIHVNDSCVFRGILRTETLSFSFPAFSSPCDLLLNEVKEISRDEADAKLFKVEFHNGDNIKGAPVNLDSASFALRTMCMGELSIPLRTVTALTFRGVTKDKVVIGGDDGLAIWKILNGDADVDLEVPGWKMEFEVDEFGFVSGGNTNVGDDEKDKKVYRGTFRDGKLDVNVCFPATGQVNRYSGNVKGGKFNGELVLVNVGSDEKGCAGDRGTLSGSVSITKM